MGSAIKKVGSVVGKVTPAGLLASKAIGGSSSSSTAPSAQLFSPGNSAERIGADFEKGAEFGRNLVPEGSLGRLGDNADLQAVLQARRELSQGFSAPEFQARRDQASQSINQNTELARRRLAAAQARAGVRGATAGAQQLQVLGQGLDQQRQLDQNLLIQDRQARTEGLAGLERSASGIAEFDISQAAKERFSELQTGLAFGQLGAAERGANIAANASVQSASLSKPRQNSLLDPLGVFGGGSK